MAEKKEELRIDKPDFDDRYWYIEKDGEIYNTVWKNTKIDNCLYDTANIYLTKELAEKALVRQQDEMVRTYKWIENWVDRNDDGFVTRKGDRNQEKWFVYYSYKLEIWSKSYHWYSESNNTYMSKENAEKLVNILNGNK